MRLSFLCLKHGLQLRTPTSLNNGYVLSTISQEDCREKSREKFDDVY